MIRIAFANAARVLADRKGVTAAEYAILATGVIIAIGTALTALSGKLETMFGTLIGKLPT